MGEKCSEDGPSPCLTYLLISWHKMKFANQNQVKGTYRLRINLNAKAELINQLLEIPYKGYHFEKKSSLIEKPNSKPIPPISNKTIANDQNPHSSPVSPHRVISEKPFASPSAEKPTMMNTDVLKEFMRPKRFRLISEDSDKKQQKTTTKFLEAFMSPRRKNIKTFRKSQTGQLQQSKQQKKIEEGQKLQQQIKDIQQKIKRQKKLTDKNNEQTNKKVVKEQTKTIQNTIGSKQKEGSKSVGSIRKMIVLAERKKQKNGSKSQSQKTQNKQQSNKSNASQNLKDLSMIQQNNETYKQIYHSKQQSLQKESANKQPSHSDLFITRKKHEDLKQEAPIILQIDPQSHKKVQQQINMQLRDILGNKNQQSSQTPQSESPDIQKKASERVQQRFRVLNNKMKEADLQSEAKQKALQSKIPNSQNEKNYLKKKTEKLPKGLESKSVLEFQDLQSYINNQYKPQLSFTDFQTYIFDQSEEQPQLLSQNKKEEKRKEEIKNDLDEFEPYESSEEKSYIQKKPLEEVKQQDQQQDDDKKISPPSVKRVKVFQKHKQPVIVRKISDDGEKKDTSDQQQQSNSEEVTPGVKKKVSLPQEKPPNESFIKQLTNSRLSSIHGNEGEAEDSALDLEHEMVKDVKADVDKLYRKMSRNYENQQSIAKMFEGFNEELNTSQLRKDIDRLKNKIITDHS